MSCRPRHSRFDPPMALLLDCLIHDSGELGHVSIEYSPGVGPKGPSLVRFYVIKKNYIKKFYFLPALLPIKFCSILYGHNNNSLIKKKNYATFF